MMFARRNKCLVVLLLACAMGGSLSAFSHSTNTAQVHIIDGLRIECITLLEDKQLMVKCYHDGILKLTIRKQDDSFVAILPPEDTDGLGIRINERAYQYPIQKLPIE